MSCYFTVDSEDDVFLKAVDSFAKRQCMTSDDMWEYLLGIEEEINLIYSMKAKEREREFSKKVKRIMPGVKVKDVSCYSHGCFSTVVFDGGEAYVKNSENMDGISIKWKDFSSYNAYLKVKECLQGDKSAE